MTKQEKKYYVFVYKTLTDKNGFFKLTDIQAIDAMALSVYEYDAILECVA